MRTVKRRFKTSTTTGPDAKPFPILFGLASPSGGGKTLSALRLATGIERGMGAVTPEDFRKRIALIDTENGRALPYRKSPVATNGFEFTHLAMTAPFSPLDYLAAIEQAVAGGATTIIVDQLTYEHEGEGGVLEMHEAASIETAKKWYRTQDPEGWQIEKTRYASWAEPKAERRRLTNALTSRWPVNFILCFRAKAKSRPAKTGEKDAAGKDVKGIVGLGFMPLGASEHLYEMTARALLLPNADGVPEWSPDDKGSKTVFKLPRHFEHIFLPPHQLCEDDGEAMAKWSRGGAAVAAATPQSSTADINTLLMTIGQCSDLAAWKRENAAAMKQLSKEDKKSLGEAGIARRAELEKVQERYEAAQKGAGK